MERKETIINGFLNEGVKCANNDNFFDILKNEVLKLEEPSKTILLKRYEFDEEPQTLQIIAEQLGIEREEVRKIEYEAYKKILNALKELE